MHNRREFLHAAAAGASALLWSRDLDAFKGRVSNAGAQEIWPLVREQFLIPRDRIYLNVGTLGAQPRAVVDAVIEHTRRVAMSLPPAIDWNGLKARTAALLNCDPAGLVYPRNTTEAMNFVANGLDLGPSDEIITTTHEHIGGLCAWQLVSKRRGATLRQIPIGDPARADRMTPDAAYDAIRRAITPRTRVVSVSHVNFTNGLIMPVRRIVELCRERNIISVIDGAHPPGLMRVDLRAIDPDFYAASPHKWLLAPQGTGLLYIGENWRDRLWPTLASGGWDDLSLGAHRFNHLGTLDESRLAGLDAALRFHEAIGHDRTYARIAQLRKLLYDQLSRTPGVRMMSPLENGAGMVSFVVDGVPALEVQKRLAEHNVRTRVIGEYDYGWMRLSPHVYTGEAEARSVASLLSYGRF